MPYIYLKLFHILCAGIVLASIGYCYHLWKHMPNNANHVDTIATIQKQTFLWILPLSILQLATGFSIISLQSYDYSELWVMGSTISFIVVIASWFGFVYFLLLAQQIRLETSEESVRLRKAQRSALIICKFALVIMIFFMATRTSGWH